MDEYASCIRQTKDGGYIVAGTTTSSDGMLIGDLSGSNAWVVKMSSGGGVQWKSEIGGSKGDNLYSIEQTADGGYIAAGSSYSDDWDVPNNKGGLDWWIVKLNNAGAVVWSKSLGGSKDDEARSICQTSDGGYIVAGYTDSDSGDISVNKGSRDFWIVKLDGNGTLQWQKSYGGGSFDYANAIRQTTDGGYIVAGTTYSSDGDVSGNHSYGGYTDCWIIKLNSAGNLEWQKALGGPMNEGANSIELTSDGGYIMAGYSSSSSGDVSARFGERDYWVVKLSASGAIQWQKVLGYAENEIAYDAQQTTDSGYIIVGFKRSTYINSNYWIVKLNNSGNLVWEKTWGGSADDDATSIRQTTDQGFIIAGSSLSYSTLSGHHGWSDYLVVKLGPDPTAVSNITTNEGFSLSPNPATTEILLQSTEPMRSVLLTDVSGKEVYRATVSGNNLSISTTSLPNGLYLVRIQTTNGMTTQKLLVQH